MDFTLKKYQSLLQALLNSGYNFETLSQFLEHTRNKSKKTIILRHDVDRLPSNAFQIAQLEYKLGIKSSYYFRMILQVFKPGIINHITKLNHEIGYHYEDLTLSKGDIDKAYSSFKHHLEKLRTIYPVKTICMHGSPRSKWDSKKIWEKYDYRDLGIIGEPYFDINFDDVFYLTDTGRRWDGWKVSLRDKVAQQEQWKQQGLVFHGTNNIIKAAQNGKLPNKIMITTHPERWTDRPAPWVKELVWQNVKNMVKFFLVKVTTK